MKKYWDFQGLELGDAFIESLDSGLFRSMRIISAVRWLLIALSLLLMGSAILMNVHRSHRPGPAPPLHQETVINRH
jgi:hypothetical protein